MATNEQILTTLLVSVPPVSLEVLQVGDRVVVYEEGRCVASGHVSAGFYDEHNQLVVEVESYGGTRRWCLGSSVRKLA